MPEGDPRPSRGRSRWGWWLVGMVCLVLVLGLLRLAYPLYRQQQIVAELLARDFQVDRFPYFDQTWPEWMTKRTDQLVIQGASVTMIDHESADSDDLKLASELLALTYNDSSHPPSSDLMLVNVQATDAGWAHLSGARSLRHLRVVNSTMTEANLACLDKLPLLSLMLIDTSVTDSDLAGLQALTTLTYLDLTQNRITDAGLVHLETLTALENLLLDDTQITARGLPHLLKLTRLRELRLAGTKVSDAAVPILKRMTMLKTLALDRTRVSRKGYAEVQAALPDTEVSW